MVAPSEPPVDTASLAAPADIDRRPTQRLSPGQLFQISAYWFALNAIWGGFEIFQQKRTVQLLGDEAPLALGPMEILALPIAALTMPMMGSISDYTTTRWGRRKPFILVGSAATSIALFGLALAPSFPLLCCSSSCCSSPPMLLAARSPASCRIWCPRSRSGSRAA
jgi:MFS family permease